MLVRDKHSSLLGTFLNYGWKKFYNIGPWGHKMATDISRFISKKLIRYASAYPHHDTRMLIILICDILLQLLEGGQGYKTSSVMPQHNKLGCSCQLSLKLQVRPGAKYYTTQRICNLWKMVRLRCKLDQSPQTFLVLFYSCFIVSQTNI